MKRFLNSPDEVLKSALLPLSARPSRPRSFSRRSPGKRRSTAAQTRSARSTVEFGGATSVFVAALIR